MTRTWNGRVRPLHGLTATLMMILSLVFLGMAPASADPGKSDHSQGNASTRGSYDDPQPQSTADQNSAGANGKCPGGPYCSTRDGSASGNGNGGGQATGKPCAGCVGKADNKNPKGQYPGPSDRNNGYECDGNHGIARSNPAHTGCTSTTAPASQPATPPTTGEQAPGNACTGAGTMTPGEKACTQPCPTAASMSAEAEGCATAAVQAPAVAPEAEIKGVEAFAPPSLARVAPVRAAPAHAQVAPASAGFLPAGLLPNTGAGPMLLILLVGGLVLVGIGAVSLLGRRRRIQH
jgi:LPXTG-motif cell wall-anchored protein